MPGIRIQPVISEEAVAQLQELSQLNNRTQSLQIQHMIEQTYRTEIGLPAEADEQPAA